MTSDRSSEGDRAVGWDMTERETAGAGVDPVRCAPGRFGSGVPARFRGFTLLEVLIALAVLTVSLMILVGAQSNSVRMTLQADRILIGTMLAKQKLAELEMFLESEPGFSEQDEIVEEGDFEEMFPGQYPEYRWRTYVRKLDLRGASTGGVTDLLGFAAGEDTQQEIPGMPDEEALASMINLDEISEQLARFIREITVVVYWDFDGDFDEVVLTTHVIKPTGPAFVSPEDAVQVGGVQ